MCKCRSGRPATTMVCVPVQSGFTEYVPVPRRQPGASRCPFVATASTCVKGFGESAAVAPK